MSQRKYDNEGPTLRVRLRYAEEEVSRLAQELSEARAALAAEEGPHWHMEAAAAAKLVSEIVNLENEVASLRAERDAARERGDEWNRAWHERNAEALKAESERDAWIDALLSGKDAP